MSTEMLSEQEKRQMIASSLNLNMLVSAGAGAGKTTLITQHILSRLRKGEDPGSIVVITFTKAAAAELMTRLMLLVSKAIACKDESVEERASHKEEYLKTLTDEEIERLEKAFQKIDSMIITTIHGSCKSVIDNNYLFAGLPSKYEILTDSDEEEFVKGIFSEWFNMQTHLENYFTLLGVYSSYYTFNNIYNEFKKIKYFSNNVDIKLPTIPNKPYGSYEEFEKDFRDVIGKLIRLIIDDANFINKYKKFSNYEMDTLKEVIEAQKEAAEVKELLKAGLIEGEEPYVYFIKGTYELAGYLCSTSHNKLKIIEVFAGYFDETNNIAEKVNLYGIKSQGALSKISDARSFDYVKVFVEPNKEKLLKLVAYKKWAVKDYLKNVIEFAVEAKDYFQRLRSSSFISNDDLLQKMDELTMNNEILKSVSNRYKRFYVDEFQDTDNIQSSFINRLVSDDEGNLKDGAIICVGDIKQSIYMFRGAQPTIFTDTQERFNKLENAEVFELGDNYRSNQLIIDDFVNYSYETKNGNKHPLVPGEFAYSNMNPRKLIPAEVASEAGVLAGAYQYDLVTEIKKEEEIELVAKLIKRLVTGKYRVYDPSKGVTRPIRYADFLVLTPVTSKMPLYVKEFYRYSIPVEVSGKIRNENMELKTFMNIYKYLANPDKPLYQKMAMECFAELCGKDQTKIDSLLQRLKEDTKDMKANAKAWYLMQQYPLYIRDKMSKERFKSLQVKLYQMLESLNKECFLSDVELIKAMEEYYQKDIERELVLDPAGDALAEMGVSGENQDGCVRLMNYHKSKGLQGVVTIICDRRTNRNKVKYEEIKDDYLNVANEYYSNVSYLSKSYSIVNDYEEVKKTYYDLKSTEDNRLEYVACTRAEQVLIFMPNTEKTKYSFEGYDFPLSLKDAFAKYEEPVSEIEGNTQVFGASLYQKEAYPELSELQFEMHSPSENEGEHYEKIRDVTELDKSQLMERPANNVVGTTLHKVFELMADMNDLFTDNEQLVECCVTMAMNSCYDLEDKISETKEFLKACAFAFVDDLKDILNSCESYSTEMPFVTIDGKLGENGFIDLHTRNHDGSVVIYDYKSDDDLYTSEESFKSHLQVSYESQMLEYRKATSKINGVSMDLIKTKIVSFSQKDENGRVLGNKKIRVRISEII